MRHEGGWIEKRQQGRTVQLKELKQLLPDLDGQQRRIQNGRTEGRLSGRGGGHAVGGGLSGALAAGVVDGVPGVVAVGQGIEVAFLGCRGGQRSGGRAGSGRGIETLAVGGGAGSTSGAHALVDAFDLAPAAADASNAGAHLGRGGVLFLLQIEGFSLGIGLSLVIELRFEEKQRRRRRRG